MLDVPGLTGPRTWEGLNGVDGKTNGYVEDGTTRRTVGNLCGSCSRWSTTTETFVGKGQEGSWSTGRGI